MLVPQLKAFHAVAAEGSFTRAAARLKMTQPAVSKQVKDLEGRYGVTLCARQHGRITLTEHGEHLYALTAKIILLSEEADNLLRSVKRVEPAKVHVGTDSPYSVSVLMSNFRQRHPQVALSLTMNTAEEVRRQLLSAAIDVALLIRVDDDPRLQCMPFTEHRLVAVVPLDHPLRGESGVCLRDLAAWPMVMRAPTHSLTSRLLQAALQQANIEPLVSLTVDSREAMKEAVAAGLGFGVQVESEARADRRLVALPLRDVDLKLTEYIACLQSRCDLKAIRSFLSIAKEIASHQFVATPTETRRPSQYLTSAHALMG